ncbi:hypothetical protein [Reichenbachiella sp.]
MTIDFGHLSTFAQVGLPALVGLVTNEQLHHQPLLSFRKEIDDSRMTGEILSGRSSLPANKKIPPRSYGMT